MTVEANPETVDEASLAALRAAGVTRISLGMQSAVPHVLAVLDRVHQPGRPAQCARWARAAGFEHVSLDLIYGTPGESDADWRESLEAALAAGPDHISAYALIVEEGTQLAARIKRGEVPPPDDDAMADRYLTADDLLAAAGLHWYEISNWAAGPGVAVPAQPALLGERQLVGRRARRAQPRRRHPVVERPAPVRVRRACVGRRKPRAGPGDFDRTRAPPGTDPAAHPPFGGLSGDANSTRPEPAPRGRPWRTGWPSGRHTRRDGWCSPGGAACSPTPWSGT